MRVGNKLLLLFLLPMCCLAQREQLLRGRVVSDSVGVPSITVMNLVTEQVVASNASGEFSIRAKEDDLLIFSSVNYEYKRRIISADDLRKGSILVKLIPKVTQLDEVTIYPDIDPASLGLVPANQKRYTPAERRLKQAGEFKPSAMLGMIAGLSIPVDPILNAISGRTKMLKKDVKTERKEMALEKLASLYKTDFYTGRLKIPADHVDGFRHYIVEDAGFLSVLEAGNKVKTDFQLSQFAQKYNELLCVETK